MSIPRELTNSTAVTRHSTREIHNAVDDLPEFGHSMAYSQGIKLFFETLTPRAVLVIEHAGYEITETSYVTNSRGRQISIGVQN